MSKRRAYYLSGMLFIVLSIAALVRHEFLAGILTLLVAMGFGWRWRLAREEGPHPKDPSRE